MIQISQPATAKTDLAPGEIQQLYSQRLQHTSAPVVGRTAADTNDEVVDTRIKCSRY